MIWLGIGYLTGVVWLLDEVEASIQLSLSAGDDI